MELVLLGTGGGGWLRANRHGIAEAVVVAGEPLLFDCGEGATRQLLQAGIQPAAVEQLFFTHHHFDHTTDYPYFALATWPWRNGNLKVYGPPGTAHVTDRLFGADGAFRQDQSARVGRKSAQALFRARTGKAPSWIEVDVTEIESSGSVCRAERWDVRATFTQHVEPHMETLAYRVDSDDGSVVIAVDSAPTSAVVNLARGADILLHECSASQRVIDEFGLGGHTGPKDVARVAVEAGVRKLVLDHFLIETDNAEMLSEMAQEVRSIFSGEVYIGEDLMRVQV